MSEADFLWKGLIVVAAIMSAIGTPLSVWLSSRRTPPVTEELYRDFATKEEVRQLRQEFLSTSGEIFDVMRKLKESLDESMRPLVAQINRLEGVLSRCPGPENCFKDRQRGGRQDGG